MTTTATPEIGTKAAEALEPSRTRWRRVALGVAGGLVLVLAVLALLAIRYDQARRDELLPGVRVGGALLGGENAAAVRARFQERVPELSRRTVRVVAGPMSDTVTLGEMGVASDVDAPLARARDDADDMGLARRLWHRVLDKPVDRTYAVRYHVERGEVRDALADLQTQWAAPVDACGSTPPRASCRSPRPSRAATSTSRPPPTQPGRPQPSGQRGCSRAGWVEAPLIATKPKVTGFADVILIRTGETGSTDYENGALQALPGGDVAGPADPTPKGNFQIVLKRRMPTWATPTPPGGRSLPRSIPRGRVTRWAPGP